MSILLDTHSWVWALDDVPRFSTAAQQAIEGAEAIFVSPITLYEICLKVRLRKWPEMVSHVNNLEGLLAEQSIVLSPITAGVAARAGLLDWAHRDPFNRIIAATALVNGWGLVSADAEFDSFTGLRRIW